MGRFDSGKQMNIPSRAVLWKWCATAFFISNIFLHQYASRFFEWWVGKWGQLHLKYVMSTLLIALMVVLGFILFKKIKRHKYRAVILKYLGIVIVLSIIAFNMLMPYKSEATHFIQYGIGGILSLLAFRNAFVAISFAYAWGIIDESFQRWVMDGMYLDFNDMLLNFIGSSYGVILTLIFFKLEKVQTTPHILNVYYIGIIFFFITLYVMYLTGICPMYEVIDGDFCFMNHDIEVYDPSFWYTVSWGDKWHQIRTFPGMVLISLFPMILIPIARYTIR